MMRVITVSPGTPFSLFPGEYFAFAAFDAGFSLKLALTQYGHPIVLAGYKKYAITCPGVPGGRFYIDLDEIR